MKIKTGDSVQVIAGKDKGKTGVVTKVLTATEQVIIDGMNTATKHQRNRRSRSQGQIIEKSMPIHVSNVGLVVSGKPVRVGYMVETDGNKSKKVRVARPSGKKI